MKNYLVTNTKLSTWEGKLEILKFKLVEESELESAINEFKKDLIDEFTEDHYEPDEYDMRNNSMELRIVSDDGEDFYNMTVKEVKE